MLSRRFRRFLIKLTLLSGAVLLALLLVELALRIAVPASRIDLFRWSAATQRSKVMAPNCEGTVYGVPLRTNELGFRDATTGPIPAKAPGEYRVAVLGDSFTVCAGVPFAAIASARLEAMLQGKSGRVLNFGTAGYCPIDYELVLNEVALGQQPDCVIVALYPPNDFETKTRRANREIALGHQLPENEGGLKSLYLHRAFGATLGGLWARLIPGGAHPAPADDADDADGWRENTDALLRMAARAQERGLAFHVCLLPHPSNFSKQADRHRTIALYCLEHGIAVTDLLPRFVATGQAPRAFRLNLIDSHPNAAYNEIVAAAMFDALPAQGLAPAP